MEQIKHYIFVSLLISAGFLETVPAATVKAMTFNIRYPAGSDVGQLSWDVRKDLVIDVVRKYQPDFLGLQEVVASYLPFLEDSLSEYDYFGRFRYMNGDFYDEGCHIFYVKERWEVVEGDSGTFQLSETPEVIGSVDWTSLARVTTWGRFREISTDQTLYLFNTHWDHVSGHDPTSRLCADRIANREEPDDPVIFMGDFNQNQDQNSIRYLLGEDVFDTPPPITMLDTDPERRKIDHVFIWPDTAEVIEAGVIVERYDVGEYTDVRPSDHDPTMAELRFWPDVVSIADRAAAEKQMLRLIALRNGTIAVTIAPSLGGGPISPGTAAMYTLDGRKIQMRRGGY
jgi:endonuclease/exonuclease/phosphatase family metal-dependent hydrolase